MGASPKSKRQQPARRFEDYVLTYSIGESLFPIKSESMSYLSRVSGFPTGGPGIPNTSGHEIIDIGFDFNFDNRTYKKLYVNTRGFATLVDPTLSNPNVDDVLVTTLDESYSNSAVKTSVWDAAHVILAPWWDLSVINIWDSVETATSYLSSLGLNVDSVKKGISLTPPGIDPSLGGVKRFNGNNSDLGNYLVIRWKSFTYASTSRNIATFDLVLCESGFIEFRYAPRTFIEYSSFENASIAIFANGGSSYGNRYRDFSYFIREGSDARFLYENGGAIYDNAYTDTDGSATTTYTISLNMLRDWPGLDRGAVFRFSPPNIRRKTVRSVINSRDSETFIDSSVVFNDQNAFNAITARVQYPSMLPVSSKLSPYVANEMFQSGSIEIVRTVRHGLYDSPLYDAIVEKRRGE